MDWRTATAQAVAPPPSQPTSPPAAQATATSPGYTSPSTSLPEAERRQLTVMFMRPGRLDRPASQLDPEDYREVVRAYQQACTEVIQRYDGHVAQFFGDGLLVYFGFPRSIENAAQRAVSTSLGVLTALKHLNTRLEQDKGITLAVRLGMHTGLVVVGDMGSPGRQEQLALGETCPISLSRIQGLAEPHTVAISAATYRLSKATSSARHWVNSRSEALHSQYRSITSSRKVVPRVALTSPCQRSDTLGWAGAGSRLTPGTLGASQGWAGTSHLAERRGGHWQIPVGAGSEGAYSTRTTYAVGMPQLSILSEYRALPHYRLVPTCAALATRGYARRETGERWNRRCGSIDCRGRNGAALCALAVAAVPEDRYPPLTAVTATATTKDAGNLVAFLLEFAERQPVLFILEDLHWTDPTDSGVPCALGRASPDFCPLRALDLPPTFSALLESPFVFDRNYGQPLIHVQIAQISRNSPRARPCHGILQQIIAKTDGVPLFVEELTKAILESGTSRTSMGTTS